MVSSFEDGVPQMEAVVRNERAFRPYRDQMPSVAPSERSGLTRKGMTLDLTTCHSDARPGEDGGRLGRPCQAHQAAEWGTQRGAEVGQRLPWGPCQVRQILESRVRTRGADQEDQKCP